MQKKIILCLAIVCAFIGCQKEITGTSQISTSDVAEVKAKNIDTSGWYGLFYDPFQDPEAPPVYTKVPDDTLILNGEAKVPDAFYSDFSDTTFIAYDMLSTDIINADSSALDVTVRKNINTIELDILGTTNNAQLLYHANNVNDSGYYSLSVGSTSVKFNVYPATDFTSFKLLRFAFKQNKAFVYVSGKLITSFKYSAANKIGNIQGIRMGKDGYIECDNVKLRNSYTHEMLMKEDFNINGHSQTFFY
jgi:hypothetical protein